MRVRLPVAVWIAAGAIALAVSMTACTVDRPTDAGYGAIAAAYRSELRADAANPRAAWMKSPPRDIRTGVGHIAVAQFGDSSILWFHLNDKKNKPPSSCEAASSTNGIAMDRSGNLWVPDGRADTTTEYGPNCGSAKLTIADPTGEPADVALQGRNRVYILNLNDHSGAPTVQFYNGTTGAQLGTLSDPSFKDLFGIGTDNLGNVFVSNLTSSNVGIVVEFPHGMMPGSVLSGVSLTLPGAPAFDRKNNLTITDWRRGTIDVFSPPYTGAPTTAPLMGASIWCKLNHQQTDLYCGDAGHGAIDVYAYPKGTYEYSYTADLSSSALVTGVAPAPAASYGG